MNDLISTIFDDDFLGFGLPTRVRFNTYNTKDTMPAYWKRWTKKNADDKEEFIGYKCLVRTVGVASEDVNVTLEDNRIVVDGKTKVEDYTYSQHVELPISKDVVSNVKSVEYKSKDGMTYIYLKVRTPEYKKIDVKRIEG